MFERYSFVAITTADLAVARKFWIEQLGLAVIQERSEEFFIVDAGGLRLCVDLADGELHFTGSTDPVLGFKVSSVELVLANLAQRGITESAQIHPGARGRYAVIHDPDGRALVLTEAD
jgi:catechol 2,3-dioxygenase-like lactoylglutathione lyase family enzyme